MIRVFIGSASRFAAAEKVIEYSIRKNTPGAIDVRFMRPESLNVPPTGCTGFTNLRFAVPELAGFTGYAIYLDVDMIVLGDLAELWQLAEPASWVCLADGSTEVSVIDCAGSWAIPPLSKMHQFKKWDLLPKIPLTRKIGSEWNSEDRVTPGAKLVHFTDLKSQPWDTEHPDNQARNLWEQYQHEALKAI